MLFTLSLNSMQFSISSNFVRLQKQVEANDMKMGKKKSINSLFSSVSAGVSSYLVLHLKDTTSDCKLSPAVVDSLSLRRRVSQLCREILKERSAMRGQRLKVSLIIPTNLGCRTIEKWQWIIKDMNNKLVENCLCIFCLLS